MAMYEDVTLSMSRVSTCYFVYVFVSSNEVWRAVSQMLFLEYR
jgi:hypothetical protein